MKSTLRSLGATVLTPPARRYVRSAPGSVGKAVLLRQLLEPSLRRRPRPFTTRTVHGFRVTGDTGDMIDRYLYLFGRWEPALSGWMRSRLSPGDTVVDVGANIGYFSLLAADAVGPTGRVVAVEALPDTFDRLGRNIRLNHGRGLAPIRTLNVAAAADRGTVSLFGGDRNNRGSTTMLAQPSLAQVATVDSAPLAELLTPAEISTTRIVKIDVEGAEPEVLAGLLPVLERMPATVELAVEVSPEHGEAVVAMLTSRGFSPYEIENDYRLVRYADRRPGRPPVRHVGPVTRRTDLVFSRHRAEVLA